MQAGRPQRELEGYPFRLQQIKGFAADVEQGSDSVSKQWDALFDAEQPAWACRFHPTDWWHEVGCPHMEWTTSLAMQRKIFDEIGIFPRDRKPRDPMIVGRIIGPKATYCFVVAWYLDLKTL